MTTPGEMTTEARPDRALAWAIAGVALYVAGAVVSLFAVALVQQLVLAPIGVRTDAGTLGLSVRNGVWTAAWGVTTAAASIWIGRRLIERLRFGRTGWLVLAVGLLLAAISTTLVEEFVRARYGMFEPRATGWTTFTGPALVAVALAAWALLAVPRARSLLALAVAASFALLVSLLPSVRGASDGVAAQNVPLAIVFVLDVGYAIAAIGLAARSRAPAA
jgi:hypothetical protein